MEANDFGNLVCSPDNNACLEGNSIRSLGDALSSDVFAPRASTSVHNPMKRVRVESNSEPDLMSNSVLNNPPIIDPHDLTSQLAYIKHVYRYNTADINQSIQILLSALDIPFDKTKSMTRELVQSMYTHLGLKNYSTTDYLVTYESKIVHALKHRASITPAMDPQDNSSSSACSSCPAKPYCPSNNTMDLELNDVGLKSFDIQSLAPSERHKIAIASLERILLNIPEVAFSDNINHFMDIRQFFMSKYFISSSSKFEKDIIHNINENCRLI